MGTLFIPRLTGVELYHTAYILRVHTDGRVDGSPVRRPCRDESFFYWTSMNIDAFQSPYRLHTYIYVYTLYTVDMCIVALSGDVRS